MQETCLFFPPPEFDIPFCERFGKGGTFPRQYHLSQSRKDYSDGKKTTEGWGGKNSVRDLCGDGKCRRLVTAPRAAETQEGEVCNKRKRNEGLQQVSHRAGGNHLPNSGSGVSPRPFQANEL